MNRVVVASAAGLGIALCAAMPAIAAPSAKPTLAQQIVSAQSPVIPPGGQDGITVMCPVGWTLTGGGVTQSGAPPGDAPLQIIASEPVKGGAYWFANGLNPASNTSSETVTALAVCVQIQ